MLRMMTIAILMTNFEDEHDNSMDDDDDVMMNTVTFAILIITDH